MRRESPPPARGGLLTLTIKSAPVRGLARPLLGAQIVVAGPGGTRMGRSDAAGRYSVQLRASHPPEFQQADVDVTITSGPVNREITLPRVQLK